MERTDGEIHKFCDDVLSLPALDTTSPDPLLSQLVEQSIQRWHDEIDDPEIGAGTDSSPAPYASQFCGNLNHAQDGNESLNHGNPSETVPADRLSLQPSPAISSGTSVTCPDDKPTKQRNRRLSKDTVKALRSWLHQHQHYPYPNEEEKEELQQQTGLSKTQIYNWFSNARRRRRRHQRISDEHENIDNSFLSPLERWKNSPPEAEAAAPWEIMRALADTPYSSERSGAYSHSATEDAWSSNSSSASFIHGARSSTSSLEHSQSSNSEVSFAHSHQPFRRPPTPVPSARPRHRRRRKPPHPIKSLSRSKSKGQRAYQCTFCSDIFRTKYDWQRHEKALHLPVERWTCAPHGGIVQMENTSVCIFCHATDVDENHLEDHNCSVCQEKPPEQRQFSRKDHLRQHLKLVHHVDFHPSMDGWRDSTTSLKSRCGFCDMNLSTWEERIDHVAEHFKNGADMAQWKGGWGFEPDIERLVQNAMPPYLLGLERHTMDPWRSSDVMGLETQTEVPNALSRYTDLHRELVAYIKSCIAAGIYPTDKMLQDQGRLISYGYNDSWDATYADWDPMWLASVKAEAGLIAAQESDIPGGLPAQGDAAALPEVDLGEYFDFGETFIS